METTKQIKKEIEARRAEIKQLESYEDEIKSKENELREQFKNKSIFANNFHSQARELETKRDSIYASKHETNVIIKILENNYAVALFDEIMPQIIEVFTKYNGKAYGVKTKEKISDEIKRITGCGFYINPRSWCDELHFWDDFFIHGIEATTKDFLPNNKINVRALDNASIAGYRYVENAALYAKDIKRTYQKVLEASEELEKTIEKYNDLMVGNMKYIHKGTTLYSSLWGD